MGLPEVGRRRSARAAILTFVLLLASMTVWNLVTPLGGGPDEAPHVVRAASLARGQLIGDEDRVEGGGSRIVQVPAVMSALNSLPRCWKGFPNTGAGCASALVGTTTVVDVRTPAGAAPPAYYVIPAIALRIRASSGGVYLARELSALVCAALISAAVALTCLVGARPCLTAALFVGLTPTVLSISSVVNPSGIEIASAMLLWVAVLLLATEPITSRRGKTLVATVAVAASIFVLSRQLSPLWLVVVAAVFVALAGARKTWAIVSSRAGVIAAVMVGIVGLSALAWLKIEAPLKSQNGLARDISSTKALSTAAGNVGYVYQTAVTGIGWLDFHVPQGALILYSIAAGALILLGVAAAGRRVRVVIAGLAVVTVVLPILIEASQYARLGQTWQGRYSWPLAIGVLLMCGMALDQSEAAASRIVLTVTRSLLGLAALANVIAFYFALRRYEVGVRGPVWFVGDLGWDPPLPAGLLLAVGAVSLVAVFVAADRLVLRLFADATRLEIETVSAVE